MMEFIQKLNNANYQSIIDTATLILTGGLGTLALFLIKALKTAKTKTPEELTELLIEKVVEKVKPIILNELRKLTDSAVKQGEVINKMSENLLLFASKNGVDADTLRNMIKNTNSIEKATRDVLESEINNIVINNAKEEEKKKQEKEDLQKAVEEIKQVDEVKKTDNPYSLEL